jgi:hypothetical protein
MNSNLYHCSLEQIQSCEPRRLTDDQLLTKSQAFSGFGLTKEETKRVVKILNQRHPSRRRGKFDFGNAEKVFV